MAYRNIRRNAGAALFALAATVGIGTMGAGQASAETVVPMSDCWGVSPYIVDQPFHTARLFVYPTGPGKVDAAVRDISTNWAIFSDFSYDSVGRLDWRNRTTGASGTAYDTARIGAYVSGPTFNLNTGTGAVDFTFSAVNRHALWAIPTTSCSGTMQVN